MRALRQKLGNKDAADESSTARRFRRFGIAVRSSFVILLFVLVIHLSAPQNETIWSVYETTGDLIRLILGLAVCAWIAIHLFRLTNEPRAYKTWTYLGLALLPFALIVTIAIW